MGVLIAFSPQTETNPILVYLLMLSYNTFWVERVWNRALSLYQSMCHATWSDPRGQVNFGNVKCCRLFKISDNQDPVFSPLNNIHQGTDTGQPYATVTWTRPTPTDNSGNSPTVTVTPTNYVPPIQLNIGTYPVTYTARDAAGNTATLSFTITVRG